MRKRIGPALLTPVIALAGCTSQPAAEPEPEDSVSATLEASQGDSAELTFDAEAAEGATLVRSEGGADSFDPDCRITETGMAGIENPATLGDFVEAFPAGTTLSFEPVYMVDFGSLCTRSDGEDALCAIFESYDVEAYRPDIEVIAMGVYADRCRTAEGVGPGSSIADAVDAYGEARFGFSYENEAREYVSFAEAPDAYSFRAESETADAMEGADNRPSGSHGGNYAGIEGDSYFETNVAHPDARLWEIWISTPL
ncbi:hypothetical protein HFP57_04385 [Parasphingopyxis algicola]|uniref:hypothetical protein n=1 Tax=Parasphingopyxis algicola TaxID=2026624 RepID=UPI0015A0E5B2|nr:hypothetical protein [Parasphingopyxis algicola]QLC24339.1 hypothetical protein HFP57_04385 [Parasphingopyxis algicola]